MLGQILKSFQKNRYEQAALLDNYIRSQYGPFLLSDPCYQSESFYQLLISTVSKYIDSQTLALDVGCATGRLVFEFAKMGAKKSVGIDSSKIFIKFCREIQKGIKEIKFDVPQKNAAEFIQNDFLSASLSKNSFSLVSCVNVLDRVVNPAALVQKIFELLQKNGILLLVDPYDWALSPTPKRLRVSDMKTLLYPDNWIIQTELKNIDYLVPISPVKDRLYKCHLLVAKKI